MNSQPIPMVTIRLPLTLANRLATYLDNLKGDRLADQAGGMSTFTAEHQAVLGALMDGMEVARRAATQAALEGEDQSKARLGEYAPGFEPIKGCVLPAAGDQADQGDGGDVL